MDDLKLVSGEFFDLPLPQNRQFLFKYFTTDIQQQFVRYYLTFGSYDFFCQHTGHYASKRWLRKLCKRLNELIDAYDEAKKNADFQTLSKLEMGKY